MRTSIFRSISVAAIVAALAAIPAQAEKPQPATVIAAPPSLKAADPLHYAVTLEPDVLARTFKGQVDIEINIPTATQTITVHARDLIFDNAALVALPTDSTPIVLTWRPNVEDETMNLAAAAPIAAGRYRLKIGYQGKISTDASRGVFLIDGKGESYEPNAVNGAAANDLQLFTHSQPNDARAIFPGWDEPGYKTPFDAAIVMPRDVTVVGNMAVDSTETMESGSVLTRFKTTPPMSTYLVFFGAGSFQRISKIVNDIDYGIVVRKSEPANDYAVALKSMPEITQYFTDYFAQPYSLPKMDLVLSAKKLNRIEAMENWGAILGYESNAKAQSFDNDSVQLHYVNAHEISHQWIGNLVTPKRWDDLWISEGLAVYLTSRYLDAKFPRFGFQGNTASNSDFIQKLEIAKPIPALKSEKTVVYESDEDIATSLYLKGGAVFEMVANAVGDDKWRSVLRSYVAEQKGKAVTSEALIATLSAAGENNAAITLDDFTRKPGFPVITIEAVRCEKGQSLVTLSQRPYPGATSTANPDVKTWTVPLFARSAVGESVIVMEKAQQDVTVLGCGAFALNAASRGYYRVDYKNVARSPAFADFGRLKPEDQSNIVMESFGNADAKISAPSIAYGFLAQANLSLDRHIVELAAERLELVRRAFKGSKNPAQTKMANSAIRNALSGLETALVNNGGGYSDQLSHGRSLVKTLMELAGKPNVQANSADIVGPSSSFTMIRTNMFSEALSDVKSTFRNLDRSAWQNFLDKKDKYFTYRFIGINKDPAIVKSALDFAMAGKFDNSVRDDIMENAAEENPELVLSFLLSDPRVKAKLNQNSLTKIAVKAAKATESIIWANRLSILAKSLKEDADKADLTQAIADLRKRATAMTQLRLELGDWVAQYGKLPVQTSKRRAKRR